MCLLNGAFDIFEIGALSIEIFTHQGGSLPFCVRVVICTEKPEEIIFHKIKRFKLTKKVPVFDCDWLIEKNGRLTSDYCF